MLDLGAPNSEFSYSDGIDNSYKDENIEFKYLPKGFGLTERYISDSKTRYSFRHGEDYIALSISNNDGSFTSDTENATSDEIMIGDIKGTYIEKDKISIILWNNNNEYFLASSNLNKEIVVAFCEGIVR